MIEVTLLDADYYSHKLRQNDLDIGVVVGNVALRELSEYFGESRFEFLYFGFGLLNFLVSFVLKQIRRISPENFKSWRFRKLNILPQQYWKISPSNWPQPSTTASCDELKASSHYWWDGTGHYWKQAYSGFFSPFASSHESWSSLTLPAWSNSGCFFCGFADFQCYWEHFYLISCICPWAISPSLLFCYLRPPSGRD